MSAPRICASAIPRSREELHALRDSPPACDLLELRLDGLVPRVEAHEVATLLDGFELPIVATCRVASQGGAWEGDEAAREAVLFAALACEVEAVDIELAADGLARALEQFGDRVLVSHHELDGHAGLSDALDRILAIKPGRAKLVAAIDEPDEARRLLEVGTQLRDAGVSSLAFPMGEWSGGGRLLAGLRDDWIYAAHEGVETAPGQWSVDKLREEFRVERWRPDQRRFGVVGSPIQHSLSPAVFNACFEQAGTAALYAALPGEPFAAVMALAEASEFEGLSVTMPFKKDALESAASASEVARSVGAANTLRRRAGGWEAHNTDVEGVAVALAAVVELEGAKALVIGAGGASRAAIVALDEAGAEVTVLARELERAREDLRGLNCTVTHLADFGPGATVVVNATPVGMEPTDDSPVPTAGLKGDEVVLDMIYRPQWTQLLRDARERGCQVVGGIEMFLAQAAAQHRWWFGDEPDLDTMRAVATAQLRVEQGE